MRGHVDKVMDACIDICVSNHLSIEYGSMKPASREGGGDLASKLHMSELERDKGPVSE